MSCLFLKLREREGNNNNNISRSNNSNNNNNDKNQKNRFFFALSQIVYSVWSEQANSFASSEHTHCHFIIMIIMARRDVGMTALSYMHDFVFGCCFAVSLPDVKCHAS